MSNYDSLGNGIFTYLDVSTVHITPTDNYYIQSVLDGENYGDTEPTPLLPFGPGVHDRNSDYGYWLLVSEEPEDNLSICLNILMAFARKKSCQWIRLSPDATIHEDLPKYEW